MRGGRHLVMTGSDNDVKSAIFIGGLQRSGTTLVGRILASHPSVCGLTRTPTAEDEGQFVQDIYPTDHEMGRSRYSSTGMVTRWAYHESAHLTESNWRLDASTGSRLFDRWQPYLYPPEAPYFVEKSPSNLTKMRFLQAAFPKSHVVIVTRNPIVQALAVRKWAQRRAQVGLTILPVVRHWFFAMDLFRSDADYLKNVHVVSYERLISSPQAEVDDLTGAIGLDRIAINENTVTDRSHQYVDYWSKVLRMEGLSSSELLNPRHSTRSVVPRMLERAIAPTLGAVSARRLVANYREKFTEYGYDIDNLSQSLRWEHFA